MDRLERNIRISGRKLIFYHGDTEDTKGNWKME